MAETANIDDIQHVMLDGENARRFLYLDALCPCLGGVAIARVAKQLGIVLRNGERWRAPIVSGVREFFPSQWYDDDERNLKPSIRHQFCIEAENDEHFCRELYKAIAGIKPQTIPVRENIAFLAMHLPSCVPLPTCLQAEWDLQSLAKQYLSNVSFSDTWLASRYAAVRHNIAIAACHDLLYSSVVWPTAELCIREFESFSKEEGKLSEMRCELGVWRNKAFADCLVAGEKKRVFQFLGIQATLQGDYVEALPRLRKQKEPLLQCKFPTAETCLQLSRLASGLELDQLEQEFAGDYRSLMQFNDSISFEALEKLYWLRYPEQGDRARKFEGGFDFFRGKSSILGSILKFLVQVDNHDQAWRKECMHLQRNLAPLLPVASAMLRDILRAAGTNLPKEDVDETPHADLTSLLPNAPCSPYWETQLDALLSILAPKPKKQKSQKPQRLAWFLDPQFAEVTPKVQKQNANGEWTSGQNLAAKRLVVETDSLDFITAQDRKIAATYGVRSSHYYGGHVNYCFIPEKGLAQLAGHPLLFHAISGEHITLRVEPVQLIVQEDARRCRVKLSAMLDWGESFKLFEERPGEWVAIIFSKEHEDFRQVLGTSGLSLPKEALPRLVDAVRDSGFQNSVQMDVQAQSQPGDSRPVIQLRLRGKQVEGQICVRPVHTAQTQSPGEGPETIMASIEGGIVRITRDFSEERANAERLIHACPALERYLEGWQWYGDTLEDALEMMTDLVLHKDECTVEWPEGQKFRIAGEISRSSVNIHAERKGNDWFSLTGKVNVSENRVVALTELLEKLGDSSGRFVRLSDDEFLALTTDVKRALERLRLMSTRKKNGECSINPLACPALDDVCNGMDVEADTHWRDTIGRMHDALALEPDIPKALQADLRPYQTEGFIWLSRLAYWGVGACLADDMGLGKTVQTIAVMLREAYKGPCLVVAPTSVCANWEMEIARFAPSLAVYRLREQGGREEVVTNMGPGKVLVVGYGLLHIVAKLLAQCRWRMVVFDEAQALKNSVTKRSKAAAMLEADFRLALTGTPIENHLEDLWSIFNIINPGLLGTLPDYRRRFAAAGAGGAAGTTLRMLLRPFILRRLKSQVLEDLPSRTEQTIVIEPSEKEKAFYEALRRRAVDNLSGQDEIQAGMRRLNILTELTRLRRACCHASLVEPEAAKRVDVRSSKIEAFLHLLEEARAGGHRLLVFSQFVGMLSLVRGELAKAHISYQYLDGSTPEEKRQQGVAAFQSGQGDCFLISLKAGGQGLNLTAADYVVHLDPWWNPAVEDQATDRAHRIGQKRPITVYRLVMAGSVEEKILALHSMKRELAADFLEGTESAGAYSLTEDELLGLIQC